MHLTLDGTSIFNQWITAVSVDDVRKQIHDRFARALKRRELKFAPTRFLLSGKTRGRMRFLTPDEEIYDGMRIIISPVGRDPTWKVLGPQNWQVPCVIDI